MLKTSEDEITAARVDGMDWEAKYRRLVEEKERTEYELGNRLIEAEEEMQRVDFDLIQSKKYAREVEMKSEKQKDQYKKEFEGFERRLAAEREQAKEANQIYEQKIALCKQEYKELERDMSMLKKSHAFLEKRLAKRDVGQQAEETLKGELKKLLGLSIELTENMMTFAKGEKAMMPLFKACNLE